ncbi:tetratricopeptide repeat protein [Candidatus Poribacteria bacterium]|nr:tetratricopeptide repeat protein [Candidatus Poribacteria bacterium]
MGWLTGTYPATVLIAALLLLRIASVSASDPALDLGDYLFALRNYDEAITEYKRFIFFHPDDPRASDAFCKIGLAYQSEQRWTEAIDALETAIQQTGDATLKTERRIDLAVTMIASGQYDLALIELLKVSTQNGRVRLLPNPSDRLRQRALFLQGFAYLCRFNWESARQAFKTYFDANPELQHKAKTIDALFEGALHCPQKSVTVAKVLSTILPGAGQAYVGEWKNGLNALALNGLLGFASVNAALDKHYQDATFLTFFLFRRYYLGNRYRAGEAAKEFNERSDRQHAAKILDTLISR